jgi:hypothetical protein
MKTKRQQKQKEGKRLGGGFNINLSTFQESDSFSEKSFCFASSKLGLKWHVTVVFQSPAPKNFLVEQFMCVIFVLPILLKIRQNGFGGRKFISVNITNKLSLQHLEKDLFDCHKSE